MAKIKVDMTNVEDRVVVPEGDYICKVGKVDLHRNEENGKQSLKWTFLIGAGEHKGSKMFNYTSLSPKALFSLRNSIIACGFDVPKSVMSIDTDKFIGKIVGITVVHEEYKGKPSAKVADVWKAAKGPKGWGRADQIAAQKVTDEVAEEEEEEVVDATEDEEIDTTMADDVDEIDV
ncbi:MAG: DUF669 domain-containing protein [Ignavibacteria bacterium]|jgi:hypothetical protein|nr:DUF669 domain-containing protein [Ignavibacteria bacterium]